MSAADPAGVLLPGFAGTTLPDWLAGRLAAGLAGVCLFGDNITSTQQVRELTDQIRAANPRAVIAIDEEGGDVTRLYHRHGSPFPGNAVLGRIDDRDLTWRVARAVGADLVAAGVTLDLAPDADVNSNARNPVIGVRSFGADAELVARHTGAWVAGLQSTGVAASAKHFPGHGDTAQDSHLSLPVVDRSAAQLRERELLPFAAAVAAGAKTIMTSHILLPQLDPDACATFSPTILQGMLRGELGFDGVVVCDALDMVGAGGALGIPEAAVRAVAAGCDLLCLGTHITDDQLSEIHAALSAAVAGGRLSGDRLADAGSRVAALVDWMPVRRSGALAAIGDHDVVVSPALTAASFDVSADVRIRAAVHVVVVETAANIAVGAVPWGPVAAGWPVGQVLHEGEALTDPPAGAQLVIVGKDNHRHAWATRVIDDARLRHPDAVVVDMGWPDDDRAYADVATFGASRHVAQALHSWASGTTP